MHFLPRQSLFHVFYLYLCKKTNPHKAGENEGIRNMNSRLQLVYVMASSEKDNYLEEAYVSMYSAKCQMPDVQIILVVDEKTEKTLTGIRKEEVKYADKIVAIHLDEKYDGKKRSRILKTSLRNMIDGDYLFIDTDTIVVKPLYEIIEAKGDISAVYDLHSTYYKDNFWHEKSVDLDNKMGWHIEKAEHYFNSGVMYVRDNDVTRAFYKKWNENVLACFEKGVTVDQPALAHTNETFGNIIQPLEGVWNCQLPHGMQYFWGAKVIHYIPLRTADDKPLFLLRDNRVMDKIKLTGVIGDDVKEVVSEPMRGLAPSVFSVTGDDIEFIKSKVYDFFRHRLHTPFFKVVTEIIVMMSKIKHAPKMLTRRQKNKEKRQ